jgi:cytochrome c peroxidase
VTRKVNPIFRFRHMRWHIDNASCAPPGMSGDRFVLSARRIRIFGKRLWLVAFVCVATLAMVAGASAEDPLTPMEELGKLIFFDANLSTPPGMSCATCHAPDTGFTGPDSDINAAGAAYPGVVHTRFGNRKPPTCRLWRPKPRALLRRGGGSSGSAACSGMAGPSGWTLGDPLAEQAQGPFLNPLEQNMPGAKQVCLAMRRSGYVGLFEDVWGPGSLDCVKDVYGTYDRIALARSRPTRSRKKSTRSRPSTTTTWLAKRN